MTVITPLAAISDTFHKRVCPLYSFDIAGKPFLIGSSVPFLVGEDAFLLTAAHVCFDKRCQPVPLFTWADMTPVSLTHRRVAWNYLAGKTPDTDVALIALSRSDAATLKDNYWFSDISSVSTTRPKTPGVHYLLAGYPFAQNKVTTTCMSPPALATHLITGHIESLKITKLRDKTHECHFALAFPASPLTDLNGKSFRIPKPQGMSGGGVWRLNIDTVSKEASTPQLVGIGIECHVSKSSRVFIATRVQIALALAPDLARLS
ncbi:hypothetical protein [Derxia lacustris]|uniref:hypothetical protein n=1 Tax=Derxia lacustris TaxID=764842 RepID=UPI00111C7CD3|nr:hypothetical protein [Derxia lacustris]